MENTKHSTNTDVALIEPTPEEIRIALPERFTFHNHREFRAEYSTGHRPAKRYVVDFAQTRFVDSAGLGMLLQLAEHADNDPKRVLFANCTTEIRETLIVAGFNEAATII